MTNKLKFSRRITYGVEIECYLSEENHKRLRKALRRVHWRLKFDSSIEPPNWNYCDAEIVSPILKGKRGLSKIKKVCKILKRCHAHVNQSCGLHVHHGIRSIKDSIKTAVV